MNAFKYTLGFCLLLLLGMQQRAQAQVNVQIRIVPPYLSRVSDYASRPDLMMLTLTNTSRVTLQVQLHGSITGDNGVSAIVKDSYRSPQPVELGPLETKNLNANDIVSLFNPNTITYTGISAADINRGFILPEGTYNICVRVLDYDTHEPLSPEEPIGCTQFNISNVEPPTIISPANEQELSSLGPQAFPITWSTPPGASPATQYHVRIVEMLTPRNPNDAMQSATTPPFFERTVQGNTLLYGPADPQLTPGRQYALMVQAEDPFNSVTYRNGGKSEVITFMYAQPPAIASGTGDTLIVNGTDTLPKRPVVIKGQLKYRFPESPESGLFSLKHTKVYLEKVYVQEKTDTLDTKSWVPLNDAMAAKVPMLNDPMDGVLAETDEDGNFELHVGMTTLDSAGLLSDYQRGLLGLDGQSLSKTSKASGFARFSNNMENIGIMYRLHVSNPHFKPDDEYLRIVPGDSVDLRQRVLDANSYQLHVNVRQTFNGSEGIFVPGAVIRIYRLKADKQNPGLAIPFYEGNLLDSARDWKEIGDKVLIAEASTPTPDSLVVNDGFNADPFSVVFKRLFRSQAQTGYTYLISLEKGSQVIAQQSFDGLQNLKNAVKQRTKTFGDGSGSWQDVLETYAYNEAADDARLTLKKELTAAPRSKVTGQLKYRFKYYGNVPDQPYAHMVVTLRPSDSLKTVLATATTDGEGRFSFDFENVDSTFRDRRVYYVVPEVKYYAAPNDAILVQPWGNYDCGVLISQVMTYSYTMTATDYDNAPLRAAEALILRKIPEKYGDGFPRLPNMNLDQSVQFGGDQTNAYQVIGEAPGSRENELLLQRQVYTEADGKVTVKGMVPSVGLDDAYQVRLGSSDRSNDVAYETETFEFPGMRRATGNMEIPVMHDRNIAERIQLEKDMLYDPTAGTMGQVMHDPGGAMMMPGIGMNMLNASSSGVLANGGLNQQAIKGAAGAAHMGYSVHPFDQRLKDMEWQAFFTGLKEQAAHPAHAATAPLAGQFFIVGPVIDPEKVFFNNDLPVTEPNYDEDWGLDKKPWRIAGRAIDSVSKLGVKNVLVSLIQKSGNLDQAYGSAPANENGDFVLTDATMAQYGSTRWNPEKDVALGIYAPGYKSKVIRLGKMEDGRQFYDEQIRLEPLGKGMYGYVVDWDDTTRAVPARLKMIDNGMWVNTVPYTGAKGANRPGTSVNDTYLPEQQRFSMDLPSGQVKLVVMPYDRAYLTDTIPFTIDPGQPYLGKIRLHPRIHKARIQIYHGKDVLTAAEVTIVENGMKDTIPMGVSGTASFAFVNNATKDFTVHIQPLKGPGDGGKLFVPISYTFQNDDDGREAVYSIPVALGRPLKGQVSFDNGGAANGAKVYLESGNGSATDNFTYSDEVGKYQLVLPEGDYDGLTVRANYFEEGETYVSAEKEVTPNESQADLVISKITDIDISHLFGFKTRINSLSKQADSTYLISGELYGLPANENFSDNDSILNSNLQFSDLAVKASSLKNAKGIPIGVPVSATVQTDNTELAVKVNDAFNGMLVGADSEGRITLARAASDSSGKVQGKVRILDNSFEFPSSYMRMDSTDFYLGKQSPAENMAVFTSGSQAASNPRFMLTNSQGAPISFRYLGFRGQAETEGLRASYLEKEEIHLFMNLSTLLPGNIPLTLKAGEAVVRKGGVGKILTNDSLSFQLENWTVRSKKNMLFGMLVNMQTGEATQMDNSTWELSPSSGGLVIKSGEIVTGKLNIPFTNMTIIPNEEGFPGDLICSSLSDTDVVKNADFNLAGIVKISLQPQAQVQFLYDPSVGRDAGGHYKLSISNGLENDYAASFTGLDGMTNPNDRFKIGIISMLSNGDDLFSFVNNQVISYYNQVKFTPLMLSNSANNSFTITGNIDLGIPSLNTTFYEPLTYTKSGLKNKVAWPVFDFSFMGKGGVKFTALTQQTTQQFRAGGFAIAGNLEMPGGVNVKGAKLISLITEGAQPLLDATGAAIQDARQTAAQMKKEVDVLVGAVEKVNEYFSVPGDEAAAAFREGKDILKDLGGAVEETKDELISSLEDAVQEQLTTTAIPMGVDPSKGELAELAGAWNLGKGLFGQGQELSQALQDGDYMKLAGMMKNLPGMDEAIQDAKKAVVMEAKNALNAVQKELPEFKDTPVSGDGFKGGTFEFDLKNGRIFGSISFQIITLGAVTLRNGGMEMLFDKGGWYFCSGATMDIPVPIITPLKVGLLIGNYGAIDDETESRVVKLAQSVSGHLPPKVKSGLQGFFMVGGKPIVDVSVGYGIPGIASFKLEASAGAELRNYAIFGQGSFTFGMGALIYGRVYASAGGLGVSVSGGAEVNVALASTLTIEHGDAGLCVQGCVSIGFEVEACVLGGCGSLDASILALVNLGIGNSGVLSGTGCGKPGLDFSVSTGSDSCINNSNFEF